MFCPKTHLSLIRYSETTCLLQLNRMLRSSLEFLFVCSGCETVRLWHFSLHSLSLLHEETDCMWPVCGGSCSRCLQEIFREDQITAALWQQLQSAPIKTLCLKAWRAAAESEISSSRKNCYTAVNFFQFQSEQQEKKELALVLSPPLWSRRRFFWQLLVRLALVIIQQDYIFICCSVIIMEAAVCDA